MLRNRQISEQYRILLTSNGIAHKAAYENAKILHCDVSIGNILIDIMSPEISIPVAFLTDWDSAQKVLEDQTMEPRKLSRSVSQ